MLELFKAIGLGLVVILPLANPLTTVALFLGLAGEMNFQERNRQALQASVYVFLIMMVAFIGFRMLFPAKPVGHSVEARHKKDEQDASDDPRETVNIAFVPLAMPSTAGPGTIAMIISSASTVKAGVDFPAWVVMVAPVLTFLVVALILWISLRSSGAIMKLVGKGGIEAISRLMGFLLVCMGVQFVINGVLEVVRTFH